MSREERRQYERMMRNVERGPALPPAARARAERAATRRAARRQPAAAPGSFTRRFWIVSVLVAGILGYLAFSLQWPEMPWALYVGAATAAVVLAVAIGFRWLQGRVAAGGGPGRPPG
jgi:hypothetical protein